VLPTCTSLGAYPGAEHRARWNSASVEREKLPLTSASVWYWGGWPAGSSSMRAQGMGSCVTASSTTPETFQLGTARPAVRAAENLTAAPAHQNTNITPVK